MKHGKTILGTIAALGLAVAIACGEPGGDASMSCWGAFCYAPSNVDPDILDETPSDLIFEGSACESAARIDTDDCRVDCADGARCEIALLPDGREVAVLAVARFAIRGDIDVELVGERPLAVLAEREVEIRGSISAIDPIYHFNGHGGGWGCEFTTEPISGDGPGGGGASYGSGGAGGGGHCGAGGEGGSGADGSLAPGEGGGTYGEAPIVPLAGGSAGGKRSLGTGGAGGGAIQISSAVSVWIAEGGSINVAGHGGKGNAGGGGGAGGAILLEAPQVLVAGALSANGGGGGSGGLFGDGMPGQDGAEPAAGGVSADGASGGDGAYGGAIDGAIGGAFTGGSSGGGGGGGAGWIRINTSDEGADLPGVLSPSLSSGCTSVGEIAAL